MLEAINKMKYTLTPLLIVTFSVVLITIYKAQLSLPAMILSSFVVTSLSGGEGTTAGIRVTRIRQTSGDRFVGLGKVAKINICFNKYTLYLATSLH